MTAPRYVHRQPAGPGGTRVGQSAARRIETLLTEVRDLERTRRLINTAVWGIALGVMIYGAINVTDLLIDHGVWHNVAWLLSFMIDLAMCVGLLGDRVLHRYGRRDGWVAALRWMTAAMTLVLNTAKPALSQDWVGVGIHTAGPVLLMLVAEGAGSFQRQLTEIIRDLQAQLADAEAPHDAHAPAIAEPPEPLLVSVRADHHERVDDTAGPAISVALAGPDANDAALSAEEVSTGELISAETETWAEHGTGRNQRPRVQSAGERATQRAAMWAYWEECRMHRRPVTGADLDRKFGTNNYGRRVINDWVRHGQLTEADVIAARSGWSGRSAEAA